MDMLDTNDSLIQLADTIPWSKFETEFKKYYTGEEVEQDYTQAFKYFLLAAEKNHTLAQFSVGALYYDGVGVLQGDGTLTADGELLLKGIGTLQGDGTFSSAEQIVYNGIGTLQGNGSFVGDGSGCVERIAPKLVEGYFRANVNGLGVSGMGWEQGLKSALLAAGIDPDSDPDSRTPGHRFPPRRDR